MPSKPARRSAARTAKANTAEEFEKLLRTTVADQRYVLRLYVTGTSPRSSQAIANIRALCDEYLSGRYDLEVVDIYQQPGRAAGEQIIAAPTLVKQLPMPIKRMVGDLSNRARVLVGLDLETTPPVGVAATTRWAAL